MAHTSFHLDRRRFLQAGALAGGALLLSPAHLKRRVVLSRGEFSPRVLEIEKVTDGPPGLGSIYESKVKDAGMKTDRRFVITVFEEPVTIRWAEESKNLVTAKEGGYDLAPAGEGKTKLTIHNILEGHGFGKLLEGLALRAARKDAPAFDQRIKEAVESS